MFNQISLGKVASIGMATTLAIVFSSSNAKALDFSFSGISSSPLTANGFFSIDDAAIPSGNLDQSAFLDWEINIVNGGTTTTLTSTNSSFASFATGISVDNSTLDFSTITGSDLFCISEDGTCFNGQGIDLLGNKN